MFLLKWFDWMFEYSIRKVKPIHGMMVKDNGGAQYPVALTPTRNLHGRPMQQHPRHERTTFGAVMPPDDFVIAAKYSRKEFWNQWIEEIKAKFPTGKILTLRMYPIVPNRPSPPFCFFVDYIQEVRTLAQWDGHVKEPRVIGMRPIDKDSIYNFAAPGALRDLTQEELELVHLHYPKVEERIAEALKTLVGEANEGYAG